MMEFLAAAKGFVGVAATLDEAITIAQFPRLHALTQFQKDRITNFLVRFTGKALSVKKFREII